MDEEQLWVGGFGFVAMVDLQSKRVAKLYDFDDREIHLRCVKMDGPSVWVGVDNQLFRIPRNGPIIENASR